MASEVRRGTEKLNRLPWPALVIVGALAVVGAIAMVQWVLAIFAWLITLVMLVVVMVGLAFWVAAERRHR